MFGNLFSPDQVTAIQLQISKNMLRKQMFAGID